MDGSRGTHTGQPSKYLPPAKCQHHAGVRGKAQPSGLVQMFGHSSSCSCNYGSPTLASAGGSFPSLLCLGMELSIRSTKSVFCWRFLCGFPDRREPLWPCVPS